MADPFQFIDILNQPLSTEVTSNEITVSGVEGVPTSVVLLIHSDTVNGDTTFVDASTSSHTITPTTMEHTDGASHFGATSIRSVTGNGGELLIGSSPEFDFGSNDFTMDFWIQGGGVPLVPIAYPPITENLIEPDSGVGIIVQVRYYRIASYPFFFTEIRSGIGDVSNPGGIVWSSYTPSYGQQAAGYQHIAVVGNGGNMLLFYNGTLVSTTPYASPLASGNPIRINLDGANRFSYIDEFRLTNQAEWTASFPVPTAPYDNVVTSTADVDNGTIVLNSVDTGLQSVAIANSDQVAIKLTTSSSTAETVYGKLTIEDQFDTFSATTQLSSEQLVEENFYGFHPFAMESYLNGDPYVANPANNAIALYDADTGAFVTSIDADPPVTPGPLDPTENVYVLNFHEDSMFIVNTTTQTVVRSIDVGDKPTSVTYLLEDVPTAEKDTVPWVVNFEDETIVSIDLTTFTVDQVYNLDGNPYGSVTLDEEIWVTRYSDNKVSRLVPNGGPSIFTETEISDPGFNKPLEIVADNNGFIWVTNSGSNTVSKIDPNTDTVIATVTVGNNPWGLAVATDDGLWVSNSRDFTVSRIDTTTNLVTDTIDVEDLPYGVVIDDNDDIWIGCFGADKVIEINGVSKTVVKTIDVTGSAYDLDVSGGNVWVLNYYENTPSRLVTVDQSPDALYFVPHVDVFPSTLQQSNTITVTGINEPTEASIDPDMWSGELFKNSISVGTSTIVEEGDELYIELVSGDSLSQTTIATLTIGDQQGQFVVSTAPLDESPDPISFTPVFGSALSVLNDSNEETISGLSPITTVTATISNGTIILNSVDTGLTSADVTNGDTIGIRLTSSSLYCETVSSTLLIGNTSATYLVTTEASTQPFITNANRLFDPYWNGVGPFSPNIAGNTLTKVSTTTNLVVNTFGVADANDLVAAAAVKDFVFIANYYSDSIYQIDPDTDAVVRTITDQVDRPYGIAYLPTETLTPPEQTKLIVTMTGSNTVKIYDPTTFAVESSISTGVRPMGIAATPDRAVWVANHGSDTVTRISPSLTTSDVAVGDQPFELVVDDNNLIWVTNSGSNTVSVINPFSSVVIDTITVGNNPWGITYSNDKIWVTNSFDNTVTIIDATTRVVIDTIAVGVAPFSLTASDDGDVWCSHFGEDELYRLNQTTHAIDQMITVPNYQYGATYATVDDNIWIMNYYNNTPSRYGPPDFVPDPLIFPPKEAALNELVTSDTITVAGFDHAMTMIVPDIFESDIIHNGISSGQNITVNPGDTIALTARASSEGNTLITLPVTSCGVSYEFDVTTIPDTVPDAFDLGYIDRVWLRQPVISNPVPITGLDAGGIAVGYMLEPDAILYVNDVDQGREFPSNLTLGINYYIIRVSPIQFRLATTAGNAALGISVPVITTSSGGIETGGDPIPFINNGTDTYRTSVAHGFSTGDPVVLQELKASSIVQGDLVTVEFAPPGPYGETFDVTLDISGVRGDFVVDTIVLVGAQEHKQTEEFRRSLLSFIKHDPKSFNKDARSSTLGKQSSAQKTSGRTAIDKHAATSGTQSRTVVPRTHTKNVITDSMLSAVGVSHASSVIVNNSLTAVRRLTGTKAVDLTPPPSPVHRSFSSTHIGNQLTAVKQGTVKQNLTPQVPVVDGKRKTFPLTIGAPPDPVSPQRRTQFITAPLLATKLGAEKFSVVPQITAVLKRGFAHTAQRPAIKHPILDHKVVSMSAAGRRPSLAIKVADKLLPVLANGTNQHKSTTLTPVHVNGTNQHVTPKLTPVLRTGTNQHVTPSITPVRAKTTRIITAGKVAIRMPSSPQFAIAATPVINTKKPMFAVGLPATIVPYTHDTFNAVLTCAEKGTYTDSASAINACVADGHDIGSCNSSQLADGCWVWTVDFTGSTVCSVLPPPGPGGTQPPGDPTESEKIGGYIQGG